MTGGNDPVTEVSNLDGRRDYGPDQVGGKAASLNRMTMLGLPVPPAFVLPPTIWEHRTVTGDLPTQAWNEVADRVGDLEARTGRRFGDTSDPLLVSVRSGARTSMPGMMDTILNVGVPEEIPSESDFVRDLRRRLREQFDRILDTPVPPDPWEQLRCALLRVFRSWDTPRARAYRDLHRIPESPGTAAVVQAMVFGNRDRNSGTGVLFTRDPHTGHRDPYGEWLPGGQGEDVVSGRMDAEPIAHLATTAPEVYEELIAASVLLERSHRDVQDIEFTVESGRLWFLQTRTAARSPEARIRHAVAMAREGLITRAEALDRVRPDDIATFLRPRLDPVAVRAATRVARGLPAGPGIGTGTLTCDPSESTESGELAVLGRPTTAPEDVPAMSRAAAVVTDHGGVTSHAAVVCRELAVPCVVGCGDGTVAALAGRIVTVDGYTGEIYDGAVATAPRGTRDDPDLVALDAWADLRPRTAGEPRTVLRG